MLALITVFALTLATLYLMSQRRIHRQSIFSSMSSNVPVNLPNPSAFDDISWAFILNPSSTEQAEWVANYDASDKTLAVLLSEYNEIKKLPTTERGPAFRKKLSSEVGALCVNHETQAVACDSAEAMAEIFQVTTPNLDTTRALPFFKFLKIFESTKNAEDQLTFIENTEKNLKPGSLAKQSVQTTHARLLIRSGDFKKAKELLSHRDVGALTTAPGSFVVAETQRTLCQAQALDTCDTSEIVSCKNDPFWRQWNEGCNMNEPVSDSSKVSEATFLASWWKPVTQKHFSDLKKWETANRRVPLPVSSNHNDQFLNSVEEALDFVLSVKSEEPKDLLGRARRLTSKNPLWVWAQKIALQELGPQWAALMNNQDKDLMARNNMLQKNPPRALASEKKRGATTP